MTKREPADKNYEIYLRNGDRVEFSGIQFQFFPDDSDEDLPVAYSYFPGDSSRRLLWVDPAEIVAVVVVDDGESARPGEEGEQ